MLSVAWRIMVNTMDSDDSSTFTTKEEQKINEVIEEWRKWLLEEELDKIRGVQQFIIPTKELKFLDRKSVV